MVDYEKLRRKFPGKDPARRKKTAAIKAIAREYERKKAELGARAPDVRRGFPYYMAIIIGMMLVGGLVGSAIFKRGGIDIGQRNMKKAVESVHSLAVALGRYRYHVGKFPSTEEGLEQLASKSVVARGWNGPYVKQVNLDPWKNEYVYVYNGESEPPTLYSKGPDGAAGTTDDVIANRADFDAAFRDTSWTKNWVPMHLRDIVVAQTEKQKRELQAEVDRILHPDIPVEGVTPLAEDWEFSASEAPGAPSRKVRVPHDWLALGSAEEAKSKVGVYRKAFSVPAKAEGRYVALRFSRIPGPYKISIGGEVVGEGARADGIEIDVTKAVRYGEKNEVTATVGLANDIAQVYIGAGLVGDVELVIENAEERVLDGTLKVTTLEASEALAKMRIEYATPAGAVTNEFEINEPRLWSPDRPFLYKGYVAGRLHHYAVRKEEMSADGGFVLNGKPLKLKGVRLTGDLGPLGAAFNREAARRKLQAMKDVGANAVQFVGSPDRVFLELCDEMGFVVRKDFEESFAEGLCDFAGFPTPRYDAYRAFWNDGEPTIRILSHWNWDGKDGENVKVECATSCDEAELFVNGESAGRRKKAQNAASPEEAVLSWNVEYDPGELKVIAYEDGQYAGETTRRTAFEPSTVKLTANKKALADGEIAFIAVETADGHGTTEPHATDEVRFSLEGPGEILAVASGSPDEHGPYGGRATCRLFGGRAVAVLRRNIGGSGLPLKLTAAAAGLRTDYVVIPRR